MKDIISIYTNKGYEKEIEVEDLFYIKVNGFLWEGRKSKGED